MHLVCTTIAMLTAAAPPSAQFESSDPYEIVAAGAVPVLPLQLRSFFAQHLHAVQRAAVETGAEAVGAPGEAARHFVLLDLAAEGAGQAARREAARRFPHDRQAAHALYARHGVDHGGSLPWSVIEEFSALEIAFRANDTEEIIRRTGRLSHFATDAALPCHTTSHGHAAGRPAAGDALNTTRHRLHLSVLRRLRGRLDYEVRVAPTRFREIDSAIDEVFGILLGACDAAAVLRTIDGNAMSNPLITAAPPSLESIEAYHDRVAEPLAAIMEDRLESATLLVANLVGAAWVSAGQPPPKTWRGAAPVVPGKGTSSDGRPRRFVGSRASVKFHLEACSHAGRIKPTNLVRFDTARQAREAGRQPCKTCAPTDP